MHSKKDMQVFLANEEAKLAEDLKFVSEIKNEAKEKGTKKILIIVVALLSAVLSTAWAMGSEYDREKGRMYEEAKVLQEKEMYQDAIDVYDRLYGYKDSDTLISECETLLAEVGNKKTYENAVERLNSGDYKEAALLFSSVKNYEDANEKAAESYYKYGQECANNAEYENAYNAFNEAGDYLDANELKAKYKFAVTNVGGTITFGKYEQDGDTTNGAEDLVWYVLYKEDDKALLLSRYVLETMAFDENAKSNDKDTYTYADSSIRTFVNETFYNTAFTEEEKIMLLPLEIIEMSSDGSELARSENYVFLPTYDMFETYVNSYSIKTATGTDYANSNATYSSSAQVWWTSTMNTTGNKATAISARGAAMQTSLYITYGVRPAIWVDFVE